jgi:cyclopropane-fatty-acyl-phospholipid synthase
MPWNGAQMSPGLDRIASRFDKRYSDLYKDGSAPSFAIRAPDGQSRTFGSASPSFTLAASNTDAMYALSTMDGLAIAESYLNGNIELEGDVESALRVRDIFTDPHPMVSAWHMLWPRLRGQQQTDKDHISHHYDIDADFFLSFLDKRHRCYSHGIFGSDDESLEDGISHKLDFAVDSVEVKPGARVLDVGGGWGAFTEYGGRKDLRVTSLTISRESEKFLNDLITREKLPCDVRYEHLYDHRPAYKYDAIVVLGVTEHLPDYDRSLRVYRSLLKPGGKVYLDASAARQKYDLGSFLLKHIYPGNGSTMCLHDYLRAVASSPFHLEGVYNDRHNYAITARHWAERFDAAREEVERRWGRFQFRKFQIYLWGCAEGFKYDRLQAYRVVLGLPSTAIA